MSLNAKLNKSAKKTEAKPAEIKPFDIIISWENLKRVEQILDKEVPAYWGRVFLEMLDKLGEKKERI